MKLRWSFFVVALIALLGCDKGSPLDNLPPETKIFVSSINLTGDDRLTSEVTLFWSGEDQDGYVTGYELSLDNNNWTFVTSTDSTFNFDLNINSDTVDIDFYVRAIDNNEGVDPTPAYLKVPIKNSPPTARFDTISGLRDTVFGLFTVVLDVKDPDGDETLDSVFFKINNGSWYHLTPGEAFITVVPDDPSLTGVVPATVYSGPQTTPLTTPIDGFILEGNNQVFLKAVDIAGSESEVDTSKVFFAKNKSGSILIVDTHSGYQSQFLDEPHEVYLPIIQNLFGTDYDYVDLERNSAENLPAFIYPTFGFYMNFYEKIFWFADKSTSDGQLYLELASTSIQEYLNQGGKIMVSCILPETFENTSPITQFSPMDSISSAPGNAEIDGDSSMIPYGPFAANLGPLNPIFPVTGVETFYISDSSNLMFTAQVTPDAGWTGTNIVGARTTNQGNTNQVFFSVELNLFNDNQTALDTLFQEILINEFNW